MDVRCEKCSTEYEFDEDRIGANGVTVKCTACGFVFKVRRPRPALQPRASTGIGAPPQGREWLVRKADGQMIAFRELTTLQKWIVEGRIHRDDEISKNGETWKRLGNILELEPFFSVYEKAQALNDLIERGAMEGTPLELRGSEVLATMNPLTALPLDGRPAASAPKAGAVARKDVRQEAIGAPITEMPSVSAQRALLSPAGAQLHATAPPPPLPPPLRPEAHPAGPSAAVPPPLPHPAPAGGPGGTLPGRPGAGNGASRQAMAAPSANSLAADLKLDARTPSPSLSARTPPRPMPSASTTPVASSTIGRIAPRAVETPPRDTEKANARNGWALETHSTPIDDSADRSIPDVVERFEQQRRRRTVLMAVGALLVLGAGGGIIAAKYGPSGNPLQVIAARYGLLQPKIEDDGASVHVEEAQRAFDLDSLASLERADALFEKAGNIRPRDPAVRADRAWAIITRADALRRLAGDQEAAVAEAENAHAAWRGAVQLAHARNNGAATPETLPPEPPMPDLAKLHAEAAEKIALASKLQRQAWELVKSAYDLAPDAFEPARALAEYYRVQQDAPSFTRELARAKAALDKSRATDSGVLYIEAAAIRTLTRTGTDEQAIQLLEEALTARPSMNRARVLLARIQLLRRAPELARPQIDRVLESAPDHLEAAWLKDAALRAEREKALAGGVAAAARDPPAPTAPGAGTVPPANAGPPASGAPGGASPAAGVREGVATFAGAVPATDKGAQQIATAPAKTPIPAGAEGADLKSPAGRSKAFEAWMQQADRFRERDRAKLALQAYERAADLRPDSAEPLTGMGWAYIDLNKPLAAVSVFKKALLVNNRYVEAYYGRAEAHRLLGETEQAIEYYEKYLSRAPSGADRRAAERVLDTLKNARPNTERPKIPPESPEDSTPESPPESE